MDRGRSSLSTLSYSQHSTSFRLSSVESITTIVEEKPNSPLNKVMESVRYYFRVHEDCSY